MMTYVRQIKLFLRNNQVVQLIVEIKLYSIVIEKIDDDEHEINQWLVMMIVTIKIKI